MRPSNPFNIAAPAWMNDAICATIDPDFFFPPRGGNPNPAKKICADCTSRLKCLDWALDIEANDGGMPGIYGGMTSRERREIRIERSAA